MIGTVPALGFAIESVAPELFAAAPLLGFKLRVTEGAGVSVHGGLVRAQVRLEPARRAYSDAEAERLHDVFGERSRWAETQRSLLWAHATTALSPFERESVVDLHVPCSFDLDGATAKYFDALEGGAVPLTFLFSGTVFYRSEVAPLLVAPIPWDREATFALPVAAFRELREHHHPNTAALSVRRELVEKLARFKRAEGHATWDRALEALLARVGLEAAP
jgi:hypothetical protein